MDLKPSIAAKIGLVMASGAISSAVRRRAASCVSGEEDMPEGDAEVPRLCAVPGLLCIPEVEANIALGEFVPRPFPEYCGFGSLLGLPRPMADMMVTGGGPECPQELP